MDKNNTYEAEVVNMIFGNVKTGSIPAFILAVLFLSFSFNNSDYLVGDIRLWWGVMAWALSVDILLTIMFKKKALSGQINWTSWGRYRDCGCLNMGLCYGSFYLLLDVSNIEFAYVNLLSIGMITLASCIYIGVRFKSYISFLAPLYLMVGILFWQSEFFTQFLLFIPICLATAFGFSQKVVHLFRKSIDLRFENQKLITSLKEQRDIAEQASHSKTKFLAAASHDLRQPLQSITLLLAALSRYVSEEKQSDILSKARTSVTSLSELLDSLLDISKLDAGLIIKQPIGFLISAILNEEAEKHIESATKKGLQIDLDLPPELDLISDPQLVKRIISNLMVNALKYTNKGSISLTVTQHAEGILIEVKDTGIGIPEAEQNNIFNEFYQVENPERDRRNGLGLGLAIVNRLVAILSGEINITSTMGQGSCFQVYLPNLESVAQAPVTQEKESTNWPILRGLSVLIIDDETDVRESMAFLLESWGCLTICAASEQDAISKLKKATKGQVSAMIVDYRLRENKTGLECATNIMKHLQLEIPTLLITGDTEGSVMKKLQQSTIPYMHKPINPQKLSLFLKGLTTN